MHCAVVRSVHMLCRDAIQSARRQPATEHLRYGPSVDVVVCNPSTQSFSGTPMPLPFCLYIARMLATACNHVKAQAKNSPSAASRATSEKQGPNSMETPLDTEEAYHAVGVWDAPTVRFVLCVPKSVTRGLGPYCCGVAWEAAGLGFNV